MGSGCGASGGMGGLTGAGFGSAGVGSGYGWFGRGIGIQAVLHWRGVHNDL